MKALLLVLLLQDDAKIREHIAALSQDSVEARDAAEAELVRAGKKAAPLLEAALKGEADAERKSRLERILATIPFCEALGFDAGRRFVGASGGMAKLDIALGAKLDAESGPLVGRAIVAAFAWGERYDDRAHQRELFDVRETAVRAKFPWAHLRMLEHEHYYPRLHAVLALKEMGAKEHADAVARMLTDAQPYVRGGAADALAEFGAKEHAEAVAKRVDDADRGVRMQALRALARLDPKAGAARLVACLEDKDARLRSEAAWMLDTAEAVGALDALRRALGAEQDRGAHAVMASSIRALERQKGARRPLAIVASWHGDKSGIDAATHLRIGSAEEFAGLWKRHSEAKAPDVDFKDSMVIAIFQGKGWNSGGVSAEAQEDDAQIVVRYNDLSYQTMGGGNEVTAWGIFVLPRSTKAVIVEDNVQGLIGHPPVWKERARFGAK